VYHIHHTVGDLTSVNGLHIHLRPSFLANKRTTVQNSATRTGSIIRHSFLPGFHSPPLDLNPQDHHPASKPAPPPSLSHSRLPSSKSTQLLISSLNKIRDQFFRVRPGPEISTFQVLTALLWQATVRVTYSHLPEDEPIGIGLAVNGRTRAPTVAMARDRFYGDFNPSVCVSLSRDRSSIRTLLSLRAPSRRS